jgi:cation diffusion facilitator CzcD-associated flavoprotein CzcO
MWHAFPVFAGMLAEADAAVAALGSGVRRDRAARPPAAEAQSVHPRRPRVTVVGAGFGGIGLGAVMRGSGVADVTILDKAAGVGGVWRDNTYPGAACDVPSHLYSFSFAPGHEWTRRFAPQPDILRYLQRVADEHGLEPRLDTEVTEARWDDTRAVWRLDLADGGSLETDVLVPACGQLSRPATPRIPGLGPFDGPVFHSAQWRHDVDLTGKRVAVVGTGASAIQFVPAIVDRVAAMTVFQRSAPYLIPKPDRRYGALTRTLLRAAPAVRLPARGFWTAFFETGALGFTRFPALTPPFRWPHQAMLRRQVPDAGLRARLQPDYPVGCKRVGISSEWFPALARPHVDVVTDAITAVTPGGVTTADGTEHPADVIILGTGFATTDFLAPMKVFGPGGVELSEQWRDGARAHLGITVPGFPNLFLLYGPHTNVGSGSIVTMLESQIAYVRQAIETLAAGVGTLTVRADVESRFDTEMQQRLDGSVWTGCQSWYRTANGRIVNNWPGLMHEYRRRTSRFDPTEYETG